MATWNTSSRAFGFDSGSATRTPTWGSYRDLLAAHWADDHDLPGWRVAAAEARDGLWRCCPEVLEMLTDLVGKDDRAG